MKENLTEMVFVLDRSGSMQGLEADTIGGFNSFVERQKKEDGEAYVSTVIFDNECAADYISDARGTALNFMAISNAVSSVRSGNKLSKSWKKMIDEDIKRRKR